MCSYIKAKVRRIIRIEFIRFCIVGGTGFVINFVLLTLLHNKLKINVFIAQFLGSEIALFSNFILHNHWTYINHKVSKSILSLIIQFHATSWIAILGSTIMVGLSEKFLHLDDLSSLIISSIIVLGWNFFWTKYIIWKDVGNINNLEGKDIK